MNNFLNLLFSISFNALMVTTIFQLFFSFSKYKISVYVLLNRFQPLEYLVSQFFKLYRRYILIPLILSESRHIPLLSISWFQISSRYTWQKRNKIINCSILVSISMYKLHIVAVNSMFNWAYVWQYRWVLWINFDIINIGCPRLPG